MSYIKAYMHEIAIKHAWEIVDNSKIGDYCSEHGRGTWGAWQSDIEAELLEHYEVLDYLEDVYQHLGLRSGIYACICKLAGDCFYEKHDLSVLYGYEWEEEE